MKIALISIPTPTFNNHGAASALPYHIIKGAGDKATFEVWSFIAIMFSPAQVRCYALAFWQHSGME